MILKLKGFLRRITATIDGLSGISIAALWGILGITVLITVLCLYTCVRASPFEVEDPLQEAYADTADTGLSDDSQSIKVIVIHMGGCVIRPGVYEMPEGSRVSDCVSAAGGLTEDANPDGVNLARIVRDGEHIVIPALGSQGNGEVDDEVAHLVSINTASIEELKMLDGIGDVLAKRIITYRERIGGFTSTRQLMEVRGIGEKTFEAIEDAICL